MPLTRNIIAAIELGSSKVTAALGQKEADGSLSILALQQCPATDFIRKGRISNLPKTQSVLEELKNRLEEEAHLKISQVYVGIGGMGLHSESYVASKTFEERRMVTKEDIMDLRSQNSHHQAADSDLLMSIAQEFRLGFARHMEPVGVQSENVEGIFLNLVTKREVTENVEHCFYESGLPVAGLSVTFVALAEQLLSEAQKRSGCVLVDMGAETTTVGIFKNNILRHLAVIPMGGRNITRDITSLQIEEAEAESLKLKHGKALNENDPEKHDPIRLQVGEQVSFKEFTGLVEARQEEIIANVAQQIEISGYDKSQLIGGIVITGGASALPEMEKAFEKYTGFDKDKIVLAAPLNFAAVGKHGLASLPKGSANGVISLLMQGTDNCCTDANDPEELEKERESLKRKQEQESLQQKRQEEEAQARQAEEARQKEAAEREARKQRRKQRFSGIWSKIKEKCNDMIGDND